MSTRLLSGAFALGLSASALLACGGRADEEPALLGGPVEHHARFAGFWMIDEAVARGGYSGAIFELGANGSLARRHAVEYSGDYEMLGQVRRPDRSATCSFGASWRSVGEARLVVETICDDGLSRDLVIEFTADASMNQQRPSTRILSVGGETGWQLPEPWGWQMRKCASEEACLASWR